MLYYIYPLIIRNGTSIKCPKYLFSILRKHGSKTPGSEFPVQFAASATAASAKPVSDDQKTKAIFPKNKSNCDVIGLTKQTSPVVYPLNELKQGFSSEIQSHLKNDVIYKPVPTPDVIEATLKEPAKEHPVNQHPDALKILNVISAKDLEWHKLSLDLKLLAGYYMSLAKIRLTGLVVLTTLAGYGMAPGPFDISSLIFALLGTGLTSAAANSINQFLEVPYDSQMTRTKNRVLIRGLLSPLHVFSFAVCTASLGLSTLYICTNPLTTALGLTNLLLYTSVYTPLKRCSVVNTWVGSVVGAIPPLIGWAACTGSLNSGALLMGAILYSWQFPHFNALSWNLRADYSRAGYRMTAVVNPELCRSAALRHSIALLLFCSAAPLLDLTTWTFAIDSLPLNAYLIYRAFQFYKNSDSQSSRKLFRLSLIHLPTLMLLMFVGKKHVNTDKNNKLDKL